MAENQQFVAPCKPPRSKIVPREASRLPNTARWAGVYVANVTTHSGSNQQGNARELQNLCKFLDIGVHRTIIAELPPAWDFQHRS
jgi:hypothetical protein